MMNIEELIESRRTIHKYIDKRVDQKLVEKAISLARYAPNHKHTEPVRFYQVSKEKRKEIVLAHFGDLPEKHEKYQAPSHLILVTQTRSEDPERMKEDYATLAMAIQNMKLFLHTHGVGTKWSSGKILQNPKLYEVTGVNHKEELIEALLWIGYADTTPQKPLRKDLSEIFHKL